MSENSLIVRQKYISKLFDKVESLQEGILLLEKVDNKIFKKKMSRIIQAGGSALATAGSASSVSASASLGNNQVSIKGLEGEALVTQLKLKQQGKVIEDARKVIDTLNNGLSGVRQSLEQLHRLMKDVNDNIDIKPLGDAQLPDLSSYGKQTLYNAFRNNAYNKFVKVDSADSETLYELLKNNTFTVLLAGDKGIDEVEYNKLLDRLHGNSNGLVPGTAPGTAPGSGFASPSTGSTPGSTPFNSSSSLFTSPPSPAASAGPGGTPSASSQQTGGFFSSFFMPKNNESSVTSSEMPFTAQNLYSETSNY